MSAPCRTSPCTHLHRVCIFYREQKHIYQSVCLAMHAPSRPSICQTNAYANFVVFSLSQPMRSSMVDSDHERKHRIPCCHSVVFFLGFGSSLKQPCLYQRKGMLVTRPCALPCFTPASNMLCDRRQITYNVRTGTHIWQYHSKRSTKTSSPIWSLRARAKTVFEQDPAGLVHPRSAALQCL